MSYDPQKHHRRSIRLKEYDYSQPGWYFVTIVTQNREWLFGEIKDGVMVLNDFGRIVEYHWKKLPKHFQNMDLDAFQIMPNHLHGIIHIVEYDITVGAKHSDANKFQKRNEEDLNASPLPPTGTKQGSLGAIMQNFQSITSRKINQIRKTPGHWLWQRNYWERIIRDENELNRIREYIRNNPAKWNEDEYYL